MLTELIVEVFGQHGEVQQQNLIAQLTTQSGGLQALLDVAQGRHPASVMRWVASGLGYFDTPESKSWLRSFLGAPQMSVRLHAIRAARRLADPELMRVVLSLTRDPSGGIRLNALEALADCPVAGFEQELERLLHDEKAYIRKCANAHAARFLEKSEPDKS